MNVEQIPGVGPQLASAIRKKFGSDDHFFAAARDMDLAAVEQIEGISPKRAVELVRQATGGIGIDAFLATAAARKVHEEMMARLNRFAATSHGRNRLALLGPLADESRASQRIKHVMDQKDAVAGLNRPAIRRALRQIGPLREPNPVCDTTILVMAGSDEAFERLHGLGVGRWCYLGSPRDGTSSAADLTILAYDDESGDWPADLEINAGASLADFAPQAWLAWTKANAQTLEACAELALLLDRPSVAKQILDAASPVATVSTNPADIRRAVSDVCKSLNDRVEAALDGLAIPATEMMHAMAANKLPSAIAAEVSAAIQAGNADVTERTGLRIQPFLAQLPIVVDDEELDRTISAQESESKARAFTAQASAAKLIAKNREALAAEVAAWLEYDADFALGCFALHYNLEPPRFGSELSFANSTHLALADVDGAQQIEYQLGGKNQIAVLTGANSGGKSTLLEHLCQLALMARFGLPVVGTDVTIPWFDEVHLITARRGLDAGAFETFLKGFLPVAAGDAKRLVLADEVESVTELESAGRILAFFIDRLAKTDSMGLLVTHMAHHILTHVKSSVRIDGIEATGLDDEYNLVVDRCPKMGKFARSTPELIVQRLVATSRGEMQSMFQDLQIAMTDSETRK